MTRLRPGLLVTAAALTWACAPPGPPRFPEGEDYVFPTWSAGETHAEESRRIRNAWQDVLVGKAAPAAKEFERLLNRRPGLVPAETGLAYARLRMGRWVEARTTFEAVLVRRPDYLPALLGAGSAAVRLREPETALWFYRRAQSVWPGDATARRRLAEVKLRITERRVAAASVALAAGESARAMEEYRRALEAAPEVGGVRVELANLLVTEGDLESAVAALQADPGDDRQVLLRLGELLFQLNDYARALEAYRRILARDPKDAEALRRAHEARESLELLRMPEEYRRIPSAPRITRADLAALVSVKVTALARVQRGEPQVAVDISGSWAREHIIEALAHDIVEVYPNHTFQPAAIVRRGDLARAVGRILDLLEWPSPPTPALGDMSPSNLFHEAAARAVGAGLMDLTPAGAFEPWRPVSGRDAVDVIEALIRLVGP